MHKQDKTLIGIKKAQSLMEKIRKMIESGEYCIDIIQQNLAVIGLLKSANIQLLQGHMNSCVKNAIKARSEKRLNEMMDELLVIMQTAQKK